MFSFYIRSSFFSVLLKPKGPQRFKEIDWWLNILYCPRYIRCHDICHQQLWDMCQYISCWYYPMVIDTYTPSQMVSFTPLLWNSMEGFFFLKLCHQAFDIPKTKQTHGPRRFHHVRILCYLSCETLFVIDNCLRGFSASQPTPAWTRAKCCVACSIVKSDSTPPHWGPPS